MRPHRVVLLSSIYGIGQQDRDKTYEHYARSIWSRFQGFYFDGREVEIRAIHDATQVDLFLNLHDPENLAVFWLSHANSNRDLEGTNLSGRIVSAREIDVAPLFRDIHPNIKWVGVIGCKTRPIFERYFSEGNYADNAVKFIDTGGVLERILPVNFFLDHSILKEHDGLVIDSSDFLREASVSLSNSLDAARTFLEANAEKPRESCRSRVVEGILVQLRRFAPANTAEWLDSVIVSVKDRPVAAFPTTPIGETQEIFVPWDRGRPLSDLKFVIDNGGTSGLGGNKANLGRWTVETRGGSLTWEPLMLKHRVLGNNQNVYRLKEPHLNGVVAAPLVRRTRFSGCKALAR